MGPKRFHSIKLIPLLLDAVNKGKIPVAQADSELDSLPPDQTHEHDMYRYKATAAVPAYVNCQRSCKNS